MVLIPGSYLCTFLTVNDESPVDLLNTVQGSYVDVATYQCDIMHSLCESPNLLPTPLISRGR